MKKVFCIILIFCLIFSLSACADKIDETKGRIKIVIQDESKDKITNKSDILNLGYSDMSDYESYSQNTFYKFKDITVKDLDNKIQNNESMIVYFGFAKCPWCNDVLNILNQYANNYSKDILYVNTRLNPEWKSNLDIDGYDLVVKLFEDYLNYDENNIKHLYVPTVVFIKNGNIEKFISPPDYDAINEEMPEGIKNDYEKQLIEGFEIYE